MNLNPLIILVTLRLFAALPFAVYYSSLQLYLLNTDMPKDIATSIVGNVLALSYGSALVGGYFAGQYISYRAFFIFCLICEAIGCLTFTTFNPSYILWLTSLFLVGGTGLAVSINMMITKRYEPHDEHREKAFFWVYMSLNIGYLIGYSLAGYYGNLNEYQKIPAFVACFTLITILLTIIYWKKIDKPSVNYHLIKIGYTLLALVTLFFAIHFLLQFPAVTNLSIIVAWVLLSLMMFMLLMKHYQSQRKDILLFYLLLSAAVIFWSIYLLAPMALIIFIKNNVTLTLFNVTIAPQWIQNINTAIIILGAIVLGSKSAGKSLNPQKITRNFSLSLLLMGMGFATLVVGVIFHSVQNKISLSWIILSYILQSLGELLIGPIGYALVGRLIPKKHHSLMMGVWITLFGVAGAIASKLSTLVPLSQQENSAMNLIHYQNFFTSFSITIISAAIIVYLVGSRLSRSKAASFF